MAEVRVGQRVKVRVGAGSRIDGMVAMVKRVGRVGGDPAAQQYALAVVEDAHTRLSLQGTILIPDDIEPDWKPDIPRQAVADLHAAVVKRLDALEIAEALTGILRGRHELAKVAESLRLLLEGPTDGE